MAGSRIRAAIPHHVEEKAIGFDQVDKGFYRLIKQVVVRDVVTLTQVSNRKKVSEELFELTTTDDFDHELSYDDLDGSVKTLRFKLVNDSAED